MIFHFQCQHLYRVYEKTCKHYNLHNSRFPLLRILNTTTMILCGYFLHYAITRPKSMLVVIFRIRNKGNRLFCRLRFQPLCSREHNGWNLSLQSIGFLMMPYSCIVRPYVDIKHKLFQPANRKRLKFNIMHAVSNPLFYCISCPL